MWMGREMLGDWVVQAKYHYSSGESHSPLSILQRSLEPQHARMPRSRIHLD